MPNKRELKKDIRFITEQLIADALEVTEILEKEADKKKVVKIIAETAELHNELISRINHPDGKDSKKLVKAHFKKIIDDLMKGSEKTYEKLSKLVPKEK